MSVCAKASRAGAAVPARLGRACHFSPRVHSEIRVATNIFGGNMASGFGVGISVTESGIGLGRQVPPGLAELRELRIFRVPGTAPAVLFVSEIGAGGRKAARKPISGHAAETALPRMCRRQEFSRWILIPCRCRRPSSRTPDSGSFFASSARRF